MIPGHTGGLRAAAALVLLWGGIALADGWRLESLEGTTVSLQDFAGNWVVLNYWATWCKPCREEMPELDRLHRERDDVVVLGIAWEDTGADRLRAFLERYPVGYPVLPADPFKPPPGLEPPRVLPTSVIFGPDGIEAERFHGPVTRELIESVIRGVEQDGGDAR